MVTIVLHVMLASAVVFFADCHVIAKLVNQIASGQLGIDLADRAVSSWRLGCITC